MQGQTETKEQYSIICNLYTIGSRMDHSRFVWG